MSTRPDPDQLLKQIQVSERKRGYLKVYLGMSAGVGKTFAMLSEAHEQKQRGLDVVIGIIETHGRAETDALVEGVERLPLRRIDYRGVVLAEFDLDGALRRHPKLLLVDELPHSNAPSSRHPKRYQDIEELLEAGIDVLTAMNVQHLESLNDVVAQITGVQVRETVPDEFLERADEIEVIDIPPDELLQRLKEGKVYVPQQIEKAMEGFFRKGNLIALREMALRRAADRVDAEMRTFRESQASEAVWATRERVIVCVAPNQLAEKVVRTAHQRVSSAHAEAIAVYVENDRHAKLTAEQRNPAYEALHLAESLGMATITAAAEDVVGEILRIARIRNASLIVVGKPLKPRWREYLFGSVVDELVRHSGGISVQVIAGDATTATPVSKSKPKQDIDFASLTQALVAPLIATGCGFAMVGHTKDANIVMLYLLGVALVAAKKGVIETVLASLVSVAAYDFFFVQPRFNFAVSDVGYLPTFGVMLGVALLISTMSLRLRAQATAASSRERRNAALYQLTRELAKGRGQTEIAQTVARRIREEAEIDAAVLLPRPGGRLEVVAKSRSQFESENKEFPVAQWAFERGHVAGKDTDTLPGVTGLYIPLISTDKPVGVLAARPFVEGADLDPGQRDLLEAFANSAAVALERTSLAKESEQARFAAESERMRSSLLGSVSHDLRTPLTAILGAASALMQQMPVPDQTRRELATDIFEETDRLSRHVRDLLDMTRLESGIKPNFEWQSLEEIVGTAIKRTENSLEGREVRADLATDQIWVKADGMLVEKALVNLLENVATHTPPGTPVDVSVRTEDHEVVLEVADRGPGLRVGESEQIFEKFHRAEGVRPETGFGMGLAICRTIMQLHGGTVEATNRPQGGAVFALRFPANEQPPNVAVS